MNLRSVLRQLGVPYREHGESPLVTDGWVGLVCPYCDGGRGKPGYGVHLRTLRTHCWKCAGGGLAATLARLSGRSPGEIRELLGGLAPEPVTETERPQLVVPPGVGPLLPAHRKYLHKRGFDPDQLVAEWSIGGLGPDAGRLAWRIYIPIHGPDGCQVSWTTRAIGQVPHGQRYRGARRNESAIPRGETLAGVHRATHALVVCEGFFDAAWVGPGAVWTAGVGFSRAQVAQMAQYPIRAIAFDGDPAAQRRAQQLATTLSCLDGETYVVRTSGADPASSPRSEAAELRSLFLR